jgi:hypothetical protein
MRGLLCAVVISLLLASCAVPLARISGDRPTAKIYLAVEPANARVFLDGIYVGHASSFSEAAGGMKVVLGYHVLRFEADAYITETVEIVAGEAPSPIKVQLLDRPRP